MERPTKLMNRNFFLLWQGQSVNQLGVQFFFIAVPLWIMDATNSATLIGLIQMLAGLPAVILGPVGGAFADRYSRRTILVVGDAISGLAILSLVVLTFLAPQARQLILIWLCVVYVLVAVVAAFFNPAISAAIPDLVPEARVSTANSLNQLSIQLAVFIGQGLGGVLFRLAGAPVLFLINGLTYLFASASESLITIPQVIQRAGGENKGRFREFGSDILAGLRYIWSRPGLRELVFVSALLSFFTWPILVLLPFYVRDSLGATEDWFGYLSAAYGVGMLAGYLAAGAIPFTGKARGRLMVALIIAQSAGYGLLGLVREPLMALMLALVGGGMGGMVTVTITTIIQTTTPGEIRGRVFGLLSTISSSLAPLAMGLSGFVADLTGKNIPLIYVACGVTMGLLSVLVSLNRQFRNFLAFEQAEAVAQKVERQPASLH